ncbi:TadE/TadG family type IV pilus assembly protein [Aquidulcibacter sp.]|jgi:Flp pilus assembly protein TadG|uniref:TadE/TadG family type IV pilus assembly protein n=1 Tax=Aquidulcibacter sp. TaxID=2052990 RepID=UPI0037837EE9
MVIECFSISISAAVHLDLVFRKMTISKLLARIKLFNIDARGSLAVAFALLSVSVVLMVGMTMDYTEKSNIETKFQAAVDAGTLAAARLDDEDSERAQIAGRHFNANLSSNELAMVSHKEFVMTEDKERIEGRADIVIPTRFVGILGFPSFSSTLRATAAIARPEIRQLDIVMCIDATGSMGSTLNAVKTNALNLEANLTAELEKRGIKAFDVMRVRAIYYRDYGGTNLTGSNRWWHNGTKWVLINSSHPEYWKGVGDIPPMKSSAFFNLPADRTSFSAYVSPETATGGADAPESGLECVNEAMDSTWAKVGDLPSGGTKPLQAVYPVIAVWTDITAHRPGHSVSLKNPDYPPATKMPRTYDGLRAKWDDPNIIDQKRKLLVFFGNPAMIGSDTDGPADGWLKVKEWPGFMVGGTLTEGNTQLVTKLADAIASKVLIPTLTE